MTVYAKTRHLVRKHFRDLQLNLPFLHRRRKFQLDRQFRFGAIETFMPVILVCGIAQTPRGVVNLRARIIGGTRRGFSTSVLFINLLRACAARETYLVCVSVCVCLSVCLHLFSHYRHQTSSRAIPKALAQQALEKCARDREADIVQDHVA